MFLSKCPGSHLNRNTENILFYLTEPVPLKPQENPHAVQRPHATVDMLQRQFSFRGFQKLGETSPFKRQLSLRMNELPSTLDRQKTFGNALTNGKISWLQFTGMNGSLSSGHCIWNILALIFPLRLWLNVWLWHQTIWTIFVTGTTVTTIPEASPTKEKQEESISEMCQQLSQGLNALDTDDPFASAPNSAALVAAHQQQNSPGRFWLCLGNFAVSGRLWCNLDSRVWQWGRICPLRIAFHSD